MNNGRMVITGKITVNNYMELEKRTYLPGVHLVSKCPKCGNIVNMDMEEVYLSYPVVGKKTEVAFYCLECSGEWSHYARLELTIEEIVDE